MGAGLRRPILTTCSGTMRAFSPIVLGISESGKAGVAAICQTQRKASKVANHAACHACMY